MEQISASERILREADPFGAKVLADGRVRFRAWMPQQEKIIPAGKGNPRIYLADKDQSLEMTPMGGGWFELITDKAGHGSKYSIEVWNKDMGGWLRMPDPMSYQQDQNVHSSSMVVDPSSIDWSREPEDWKGLPIEDLIIYEMHIGTITSQGTFRAAIEVLDYLKELGITAIELMPTAADASQGGWGYDGVLNAALHPRYGTPQDLADLVAEAHKRGIEVLLDKVDNHFGPDGNYLWGITPEMWSKTQTPWGQAFDMQRPEVRAFFRQQNEWNHRCYRFDGVRRDAVHAIAHTPENGEPHILHELLSRARRVAKEIGRRYVTILEYEHNSPGHLDSDNRNKDPSVYGNMQWSDDFHHAIRSLLFRENPAKGFTDRGYLKPYQKESLSVLAEILTKGYAFSLDTPRNKYKTPEDKMPAYDPRRSIFFTHNHDQIGNTPKGDRIETLLDGDPYKKQKLELAAHLLLLSPSIPMLFQGQEQASEKPFPYFALWEADWLRKAVSEGRRKEFSQFSDSEFADPCSRETMEAAKLGEDLKLPGNEWFSMYRELIAERKKNIIPHLKSGIANAHARKFGDYGLEVSWTFGDGAKHCMRINFSPLPQAFPAFKDFEHLPQSSLSGKFNSISGTPLQPWSLEWISAKPQSAALSPVMDQDAPRALYG